MDAMTNTSSDVTSFGQDNVQASMRSGQIWMAGCQTIGQSVAAATHSHFAQVMSSCTAMSEAKTFVEALEMQKALMPTSIENAVASTGKITGANLVQESRAPVTACLTVSQGRSGPHAI